MMNKHIHLSDCNVPRLEEFHNMSTTVLMSWQTDCIFLPVSRCFSRPTACNAVRVPNSESEANNMF